MASSASLFAAAGAGAAAGLLCGAAAAQRLLLRSATLVPASPAALLSAHAAALRTSLPRYVILVRHGESQANADNTLLRRKADNLIELTALGSEQAHAVGRRILGVVGHDACVHIYVSPFQRTLQTARGLEATLGAQRVARWSIDPRIREQEFGNIQGTDFAALRKEQQAVGRFWYRFPTGESGADVYDRVRQWWETTVLRGGPQFYGKPSMQKVDAIVAVTHGLAMRLILMQLNGWSPTTFHAVWNAGHAHMYVLRRNEQPSSPFDPPYLLDVSLGDQPRSTIDLLVKMRDGTAKLLTLDDYLSVPPPRTMQLDRVRAMLAVQHGLDAADIVAVDFERGRFEKYM